jgi:hypothetical protein
MIGHPLRVSGLSEGCAITKANCTRIKDIWDLKDKEWKNSHVINRTSREIIIASIPWNPAMYPSRFQIGDWISSKALGNSAPLTWVYQVTMTFPNTVQAIEFQRVSHSGFIRTVSF